MAAVTIGDYLLAKLGRYNISLSDEEFTVLLLKQNLNPDTVITADNFNDDLVLYYIIPDLLLIPDETQGDGSQKWDRNAIVKFYGILATRLGLPNLITEDTEPTIKDRSNLW